MTTELGLTLLLLGFVGAFLSGLVGVGGAIILIPLLYYVPPLLGVGRLDIKAVAGVSMVQVLVAAVVGGWTHGQRSQVHRPLAWSGGGAMAAGSLIGAVGSRYVGGRLLLVVFAVMATIALALSFVPPARLDEGAAEPMSYGRAAAMGSMGVIGFFSGLLGAGGAFLTVPVLIAVLRVPVRLTIGTSLVMTGMSAAMGVLGKAITGQIALAPVVPVVVGALAGARVGARLSSGLPETLLRGILAATVAAVAIRVWAEVLGH